MTTIDDRPHGWPDDLPCPQPGYSFPPLWVLRRWFAGRSHLSAEKTWEARDAWEQAAHMAGFIQVWVNADDYAAQRAGSA